MSTANLGERGSFARSSVLFGAVMLLVIGAFDLIQGLVALFKDDLYVIGASGLVIATDYTAWGWSLIAWGAVLILIGLSLARFGGVGRWLAIAAVTINMVGQFAFFPAYPLWSVIAIGVSAVVLWALTFGWRSATDA